MYRTNFYGQSAFPSSDANNMSFKQGFLDRLPVGPRLPIGFLGSVKDGFSPAPSRFSKTLHDEVMALNQRASDLEGKIKNKQIKSLTDKERQSLLQEYSAIEQAQKLIAIIVENMQKCAANIVANFR